MNKPTTLLMEEFKHNLSQIINDASLPPFIVEFILRDYLLEISSLAKQTAENEISEYYQDQNPKSETINEP